jgi:CRP-like cAMP-binding protein
MVGVDFWGGMRYSYIMKIGVYEILSRSPLFNGLAPLKIEELLKKVPHRFVKYKKGNMIALRGDPCERLLVLAAGSVRGEMVDMNGRTIEVETISAPRPLAPAFIFGKNNIYPVDVTADRDVTMLSIPKSSLITLIRLNTEVLKNYLDLLSNRTHFLTERLFFMSLKTIKEKFAQYIVSLLNPGEYQVVLPRSHQELSDFFGVSRPSLARVIRELEGQHLIEHSRREIVIKNLEGLKEILE